MIAITMFQGLAVGWADLVLPGDELPRARRHDGQPRGPPPAPAPRRDPARARRARVAREARGALRRRALAATPAASSRSSSRAILRRPARSARSASARRCASAARRPPAAPALRRAEPAPRRATATTSASLRYRPLFSGPAVERVPELQFQRPERRGRALARRRRSAAASPPGDEVVVRSNGTSSTLRARVNRQLIAGRRPHRRRARRATCTRRVEVTKP